MANKESALIEPCACGSRFVRAWGFGSVYFCGCINPRCRAVSLSRSEISKYDAIRKWNARMKGENVGK